MSGLFSWQHLLIVLVIVLLVFGTKKLRNIGKDVGGAVKGFKDAMKDDEDEDAPPRRSLPRDQGPDADFDAERNSRRDRDRNG